LLDSFLLVRKYISMPPRDVSTTVPPTATAPPARAPTPPAIFLSPQMPAPSTARYVPSGHAANNAITNATTNANTRQHDAGAYHNVA